MSEITLTFGKWVDGQINEFGPNGCQKCSEELNAFWTIVVMPFKLSVDLCKKCHDKIKKRYGEMKNGKS